MVLTLKTVDVGYRKAAGFYLARNGKKRWVQVSLYCSAFPQLIVVSEGLQYSSTTVLECSIPLSVGGHTYQITVKNGRVFVR